MQKNTRQNKNQSYHEILKKLENQPIAGIFKFQSSPVCRVLKYKQNENV